jgi:hypothetical protein
MLIILNVRHQTFGNCVHSFLLLFIEEMIKNDGAKLQPFSNNPTGFPQHL